MAQLSDLITRYKKKMTDTFAKSSGKLSDEVSDRTPVLTHSLKSSWTPNNGEPTSNDVTLQLGDAIPSTNNHLPITNGLKIGDVYSYANGKPYARRIEYDGWSSKAPQGMLRISVAQWQRIVDDTCNQL